MSILALIACIGCIFCRAGAVCCQCCKGCMCNFCCGTADAPEDGYTRSTRSGLLLLFIAAAVVVGCCAYAGGQGVTKLCDGTKALLSSTSQNVNDMSSITTLILNSATQLGQSPDNS